MDKREKARQILLAAGFSDASDWPSSISAEIAADLEASIVAALGEWFEDGRKLGAVEAKETAQRNLGELYGLADRVRALEEAAARAEKQD